MCGQSRVCPSGGASHPVAMRLPVPWGPHQPPFPPVRPTDARRSVAGPRPHLVHGIHGGARSASTRAFPRWQGCLPRHLAPAPAPWEASVRHPSPDPFAPSARWLVLIPMEKNTTPARSGGVPCLTIGKGRRGGGVKEDGYITPVGCRSLHYTPPRRPASLGTYGHPSFNRGSNLALHGNAPRGGPLPPRHDHRRRPFPGVCRPRGHGGGGDGGWQEPLTGRRGGGLMRVGGWV